MTTNSKAELLNWLKEPGRLLGNDMVFAIDKAKADALLTQEYIRRFKTTSYLPPVSGETPPDNGYKVYMQNFVLDHPRLSFDNVDITSSKASLRMKIVGGNQVDLKQAGAHWYPRRIDSLDPLVGPELSLKLELSDVPGYVDDDGRIMLDLRNSDNFVLTFSDSNRVRQLGGDFFKELFGELPVEKRVWSLGRLQQGQDPMWIPSAFSLRTQRNPSVAHSPAAALEQPDVDGAVVGFLKMVGNNNSEEALPGPSYRYLIPSSLGGSYSVSALFNRDRLVLSAVLSKFRRIGMRDAEFNISSSEEGTVLRAVSGFLILPAMDVWYHGRFNVSGHGQVAFRMHLVGQDCAIPLSGGSGPLKVVMTDNSVGYDIRMDFRTSFEITEIEVDVEVPGLVELLGAYSVGGLLVSRAYWEIISEVDPGLEWKSAGLDITFRGDTLEGPIAQVAELELFYFNAGLGYLVALGAWELAQKYRSYLYYAIRGEVYTSLRMSEVVEDVVKLNFNSTIMLHDYHLPNDLASFGHVNPRLTTFTVTPLESIVQHSFKKQFSTVPANPNVIWTAESVEGSGDAQGEFSKTVNGEYLAPTALGIQGAYSRVRVTATDPNTGYSASGLICVMKNALSLSPLVEVCQVGDTGVSLKAGNAGQGELRWTVLGSAPHGRLAHATGPSNTYIPGGNITGKAYLVEQVEVRNTQSNEQRTLCVVTTMTTKMSYAMVVANREAQRLWLQLFVDDEPGITDLEVLHGPGKIARDAEGEPYYEADSASQAPFCVVGGLLKEGRFSFEGFIVLPLPLGEHMAAYQTLEQVGQSALRRSAGVLRKPARRHLN